MKNSNKILLLLTLPLTLCLWSCDKDVTNLFTKADETIAAQDSLPVATVIAGSSTPGYKDGPAAQAQFTQIIDVATGSDGTVYILEAARIRKLKDGIVTTVAGTGTPGYKDGPAKTARFENLRSIGVCEDGTVYVIDRGSQSIRKITANDIVSTYAGGPGNRGYENGPVSEAELLNLNDLAVGADGTVYFSEEQRGDTSPPTGQNLDINAIRKISPDGIVSVVTEWVGAEGEETRDSYASVDALPNGDVYVIEQSLYFRVFKFTRDNDSDLVYSPYELGGGSITVTPDGVIYYTGDLEVISTPDFTAEQSKIVAIIGDDNKFPRNESPDPNIDGIRPSGMDNYGNDFYVGYGTRLKKVTLP